MKRYSLLAAWALLLAAYVAMTAITAMAADVGDAAPGFSGESTLGAVTLEQYRGKKNVVLAFYYKDFTRR